MAMRPINRRTVADTGVGFGVGAFSGVLGVGGGILLVPYLVLSRAFPQKRAQATSLVMVACAALFGALTYAWAGDVAWLPSMLLLAGGLAGSLLGSHLVLRTASHVLQAAFGLLMIVVAGYLLLGTSATTSTTVAEISTGTVVGYLLSGVVMGVLSALFGIGGGIVLIPILVGVFGYSQQLAAGTSLAVMTGVALVGAIRLSHAQLTDWRMGLTFGIASIPGALIGAVLALAISGEILRIGFAIVMAALGLRMSLQAIRSARGAD
jgi:uncharacterized membrane protein YfcA